MRDPLRLTLARPCPIAFPAMGADERARHCGHCDKQVHNLSALTEDEARALLAEPGSRCASLRRRSDGSAVFRAVVLASAAAIAACAPHSPAVVAAPPTPTQGCEPSVWSADLVPDADAEVRILVLDMDGLPIPGVLLALEGATPREALTDLEGRAQIPGVPPGTLTWTVSREGFLPASGTVEVPAGSGVRLSVELAWEAGYDLVGIIVETAPVIDTEGGDRSHTYSEEWLQRVPRGGGFGR